MRDMSFLVKIRGRALCTGLLYMVKNSGTALKDSMGTPSSFTGVVSLKLVYSTWISHFILLQSIFVEDKTLNSRFAFLITLSGKLMESLEAVSLQLNFLLLMFVLTPRLSV